MKISRSTGYGILAAGYIAKSEKGGIVLSQTISKEYNIPLEYLLKILQQLVRANILRSKRGPRGGFVLSKSPSKITMLEIIEAVDGPLVSQLRAHQEGQVQHQGGKGIREWSCRSQGGISESYAVQFACVMAV